jgi:hypothetical protein
VDEKTAIQALGRFDPVLPLSPGRLERHGFAAFLPRSTISHESSYDIYAPMFAAESCHANELAATGH